MLDSLVSIILPVYNGQLFVAEAIDSVLGQAHQPLELIVVDDGSTDGSVQIARSYHQARLLTQPHRGVAAARNAGVLAAQGKFIAFIDQDDVWLSHKLALQMDFLHTHPEHGAVVTRQSIFLEPNVERPSWLKAELLVAPQSGLTPSALLVRLETFARVGLFREDLLNASDVDWFFRAKDAGISIPSLPDALIRKRIHRDNQSSRIDQLHSEYLKVARSSLLRRRIEVNQVDS